MPDQAEVIHQKIYMKHNNFSTTTIKKKHPPTHISWFHPQPQLFSGLQFQEANGICNNTNLVLYPQNQSIFKLTFNSTMKAERLFVFSCLVSIVAITFSISSFTIPTYLRLIFFKNTFHLRSSAHRYIYILVHCLYLQATYYKSPSFHDGANNYHELLD